MNSKEKKQFVRIRKTDTEPGVRIIFIWLPYPWNSASRPNGWNEQRLVLSRYLPVIRSWTFQITRFLGAELLLRKTCCHLHPHLVSDIETALACNKVGHMQGGPEKSTPIFFSSYLINHQRYRNEKKTTPNDSPFNSFPGICMFSTIGAIVWLPHQLDWQLPKKKLSVSSTKVLNFDRA